MGEFEHKLRGFAQFCSEFEHLHPSFSKMLLWLLVLCIIGFAVQHFYATRNPRLLAGAELTQGHLTFDAIRDADLISEDFRDGSARRKTLVEAQTQLSIFQQLAHSAEGQHAGVVMSYYLDEVRLLPDKDMECANLKAEAHHDENGFDAGKTTREQMNLAEVEFMKCLTTRGQTIGLKSLCRDETMSYLIPNRQPPVDYCIFRHMSMNDQQH